MIEYNLIPFRGFSCTLVSRGISLSFRGVFSFFGGGG